MNKDDSSAAAKKRHFMVSDEYYVILTMFVKRFYAPSAIGNAHLHSKRLSCVMLTM